MPEQPPSRTPVEGMHMYALTLRRRWRMALAIVALAAVAGFVVASLSAKSHDATAKVLLDQQRQVDALLGTSDFSPDPERELNTGIQLITLEPIADGVRRSLGLTEPSATLVRKVSTKVDRNSNIVSITVSDASAARAARIANAFAAGYRDYRARSARATVDDAIASAQARLQRLAPGAERTALAAELRRLQVAGAFQTGGVQVVHPATAATATTRPRPPMSALIGAILGVLVAAVAVAVLARTDNRVRSDRELEEATGAPVLARVPAAPAAARDAIVTLAMSLPRARGRLAPTSVVLLTSPGPREGTSDVALGLARSLDAIGQLAIAIETDLREPMFAATLGVDEPDGLAGVLLGSAELDRELVPLGGACALPAGPALELPQPLLAGERMAALIQDLRDDADVVVLAGAPVGVVGDALALVGSVDLVVLVACLDVTRVDELQRAVSALEAAGSPPVGVVVTTRPRRGGLRAALHRVPGTRPAARVTKRPEPQSGGAAGTTTEVPVA
jgi:capsular polysaccharide biosynthesis protein